MSEGAETGERREENAVAGWLELALWMRLVGDGSVYLRAQEYAVAAADEDDVGSPLVLTRVSDGCRFEASIKVDAIELPREG